MRISVRNVTWLLAAFIIMCGAFSSAANAQTRPNVMTWGQNEPGWSQKLGLLSIREGCTATPSHCATYTDNLAVEEGVSHTYISMPFDLTNAVAWAGEYSTLSLTHPKIVEVGFDDFVNKIENLMIAGTLPNPATFIGNVITAIKSKNPNLKFGITLYEDSLTHAILTNGTIPATLRARIDFVHFYVHYREDAPNYAANVATAKSLFPNAKIIAGAYPYDRIDYLPCQYKGTVPCTVSQEQSLYKQLLQTQVNMLKAGTVSGVEFFFGYFGDPQDWPGWGTQARVCNTARLAQCYSNTTTLQNISYQVLQSSLSAAISLQYPSVYMGKEYVGKTSTPGKIAVKSTGIAALAITSIGVAGVNATNFPITHNCPALLNPGSSCTITVYFKPTAVGTRYGQIVISDNAGTGTQTIALTGTAIAQ